MNTKINKITYLFPRSIIQIFLQSFDLSSLLTTLANPHVSRGRMKHNADNSKVCHAKQIGIESHANN